MKKFWVDIRSFSKNKIVVAENAGASALLIPKGTKKEVKKITKLKTISEDGDLKIGKDVIITKIKNIKDHSRILSLLNRDIFVILEMKRLEILPIENLIAQRPEKLIIQVRDYKEAKTAIKILEKGAGGILLKTNNLIDIKKTGEIMKMNKKIKLVKAKVTRKVLLDLGDRAMIDCCSLLKKGEGVLVGNTSSGMFLVQADCIKNQYTGKRAFKINAGAVHSYIMMPNNRTEYLSELKIGDSTLIVDSKGNTKEVVIGRVKIESRPLILVEAEYKGQKSSIILQNVETIHLIKPDGSPINLGKLKKGDTILIYVDKPGRHFGMKVKEKIIEK